MLDPEQLYTLEPRWVESRRAEQATAPDDTSADRSGAQGELATEGPVLVHALTGFIDAGSVTRLAGSHLLEHLPLGVEHGMLVYLRASFALVGEHDPTTARALTVDGLAIARELDYLAGEMLFLALDGLALRPRPVRRDVSGASMRAAARRLNSKTPSGPDTSVATSRRPPTSGR